MLLLVSLLVLALVLHALVPAPAALSLPIVAAVMLNTSTMQA
jgi:hypothetical protein